MSSHDRRRGRPFPPPPNGPARFLAERPGFPHQDVTSDVFDRGLEEIDEHVARLEQLGTGDDDASEVRDACVALTTSLGAAGRRLVRLPRHLRAEREHAFAECAARATRALAARDRRAR